MTKQRVLSKRKIKRDNLKPGTGESLFSAFSSAVDRTNQRIHDFSNNMDQIPGLEKPYNAALAGTEVEIGGASDLKQGDVGSASLKITPLMMKRELENAYRTGC